MRIVLKKKTIKDILREEGIEWTSIIHSGDEDIIEIENNGLPLKLILTTTKDYKIIPFEESDFYKRARKVGEHIPERFANKEDLKKREKK
jgi:hypothetical protein